MQLESVRDLKAALYDSVIAPMAGTAAVRSVGLRTQPIAGVPSTPPTIALGVARARGKNEFALAVRVQSRGLENSPQLETIRKQAKGEVDVQYIGLVSTRAAPHWYQKETRPLRIGASIGHHKVNAGTLGGFVRDRKDGSVLILSNNHVLANGNHAKKGDPILQPGAGDGGAEPSHRVGAYLRSVKLKRVGTNLVDCAVATVDPEMKYDPRTLTGLGKLAGLGDAILTERDDVHKIGRTTGPTAGRLRAFELKGVVILFGLDTLRFDDQIEIEGDGATPFCDFGDSGSLIVDTDRRAVGLLFAGIDHGGTNGKGLTYANPLRTVLDALKVDLFLA